MGTEAFLLGPEGEVMSVRLSVHVMCAKGKVPWPAGGRISLKFTWE